MTSAIFEANFDRYDHLVDLNPKYISLALEPLKKVKKSLMTVM